MGLQSGFGQNTGYSGMVGTKCQRQLPSAPVRRAILRFLLDRGQYLSLKLGRLLADYLATMTTEKAGQALRPKAFQPQAHGVDAASKLPTDRPLRAAAGRQEDDLGSLHLLGPRAARPNPLLQSAMLWRRKNQSFWHSCSLPDYYIRIQCYTALVKEIITHCYHRTFHAGIHLGSHKLHFVGHFLKKYPLAIDAVVIVAMLAFGAVTEGHEGSESHAASE
jgi:hypothetical protein